MSIIQQQLVEHVIVSGRERERKSSSGSEAERERPSGSEAGAGIEKNTVERERSGERADCSC